MSLESSANFASMKVAGRTGGVRFAPSPTGRFHLGNLRTAWISRQWAQALNVPWIVRFEDIDTPRVVAGAQEQQLADMSALGLTPAQILVQSEFRLRHFALFTRAVREGRIYPCDCSRKEVHQALSEMSSAPHDGHAPVYSGVCRPLDPTRSLRGSDTIAWRFRMPNAEGHDDFIVARGSAQLDARGLPSFKTFVPSYHWACAVDDFDGGYDLLVRSWDLAPALPLQRAIQQWLSETQGRESLPSVFHTSLVVQEDGHRLEKRAPGVTLPDLFASGVTPQTITMKFAEHFDASILKAESLANSFGELHQTLKLSQLGF